MKLVPLRQRKAREFVAAHHRHSGAPRGDIIRVGVEHDGELVAVGMAGRPVSRVLDDGTTLEVLRICALPSAPHNVNSFIYGALLRAGAALGFRRAYTYTLASESGASLRGAGWEVDEELGHRPSWSTPSRPRSDDIKRDPGPKVRWRKDLA